MLDLNSTESVPPPEMDRELEAGNGPEWLRAASVEGRSVYQMRFRYQVGLLAADLLFGVAAVALSTIAVNGMTGDSIKMPTAPQVAILVLCWVTATFVGQLYTLSVRSLFMRLSDAFSSLLFGTLIAVALTFFLVPDWVNSRLLYLFAYLIAVLFFTLNRVVAAAVVADNLIKRRVAILGTGEETAEVISHLVNNGGNSTYDLVGLVRSTDKNDESDDGAGLDGLPIIAALRDCPHLLLRHRVNTLVIPQPGPFSDDVARCLAHCDAVGIHVMRFEVAYEVLTQRAAVFNVGHDWLASLETVRHNKYATRLKRVLDVVITLLLLPIAAVIVGLCAILIKLFSPGPVFYHQTRVGKDGQHFTFTKLRTMIPDAERDTGPVWATEDDPRITRIGNILRKTRLDEVPQLWQVLTGEMSLAGPRPERPEIVERLRKEIPLYEMRQIVRPGITGWAQVNHKYDASTEDVIEKLRYDLYYIRNLSLGLDLQIVLRTFGVMLGKKGAH
jgi:exopolysaccharide biosynthesis polyprenyl glycosylphosphotransferase